MGVIPCLEITDELVVRLRISAELTRCRVLDKVAFRPWLCRLESVHRCGHLQIRRDPRPSGIEINILRFASDGSEHHRLLIAAAIDIPVCKEDFPVREEADEFAGRCLPELEADLFAYHVIVAMDGQEYFAGVGHIVVIDIRHTDARVMVERIDYIVLVGVNRLVNLHLRADGHVKRILAFVYVIVRRNSLYVILDAQRFG